MSLKTIKVNPDLLSLSGGGSGGGKSSSANTKTRKQKPAGISLTQSNNVKKKLIARIKNFQQKPVNTSIGIQQEVNNGQSNSLTESIDFLNNLAREKQEQKREKRVKHHRETLKHNRQPTDPSAYMNIATELPPELSLDTIKPPQSAPLAPVSAPLAPVSAPLAPVSAPLAPHTSFAQAPPYSNLKKGGSKPTYRTWLRNTQKNKPSISKPSISKPSISNPSISKPSISILDTEPVETNINNNNMQMHTPW